MTISSIRTESFFPTTERRAFVRHAHQHPVGCYPLGGHTEDCCPAVVRDISVSGISLEVDRPFEVEEVISVHLENNTEVIPLIVLARVIRIRPLPSGHWILGGAFINRISEDSVDWILREET